MTNGAIATDRYGGFNLQINDHDNTRVYGGQQQNTTSSAVVTTGNNTNTVAMPNYVSRLQTDLRQLGFFIAPQPNGVFDLRTEWAVREFQIYSKMEHLAQENTTSSASAYVDRLAQVATGAGDRYQGNISGIVNQRTREMLQHWIDNNWRCPVVIGAYRVQNNLPAGHFNNNSHNIWLHNDIASTTPRMYARDFSGYYTLPQGRPANDLVVLGDYVTYMQWSGPRSTPPRNTWTEAELLPEGMIPGNPNWTGLTNTQRSTYKVVRAVSEVECLGYADSVNCYDNAFISLGPCHWTLGIIQGNGVSEGELCGFLSYLRATYPAAFESAMGYFGARVDEDWNDPPANDPTQTNRGARLFRTGSRKYAGWIALQEESGQYARRQLQENEGNYFKTWHWFYRFLMAGRTIEQFRIAMWDMARMRLRDIRTVPWGTGVAPIPTSAGGTRPATIGDVFTSERAMGILQRWHIRAPGHMVSNGNPGNILRRCFNSARQAQPSLNWNAPPSAWTNAHEAALVNDGLVSQAQTTNYWNTIDYVNRWPNWAAQNAQNPRGYTLPVTSPGDRLSIGRGSFQLDDSGLPATPY